MKCKCRWSKPIKGISTALSTRTTETLARSLSSRLTSTCRLRWVNRNKKEKRPGTRRRSKPGMGSILILFLRATNLSWPVRFNGVDQNPVKDRRFKPTRIQTSRPLKRLKNKDIHKRMCKISNTQASCPLPFKKYLTKTGTSYITWIRGSRCTRVLRRPRCWSGRTATSTRVPTTLKTWSTAYNPSDQLSCSNTSKWLTNRGFLTTTKCKNLDCLGTWAWLRRSSPSFRLPGQLMLQSPSPQSLWCEGCQANVKCNSISI